MLLEPAHQWGLQTKILDPDPDCPCRHITQDYHQGDFRDYQTVVEFGKKCNVVTIEIEQVNIRLSILYKKVIILGYIHTPRHLNYPGQKSTKEFFNRRQFPTSDYTYHPRLPDSQTQQSLAIHCFGSGQQWDMMDTG